MKPEYSFEPSQAEILLTELVGNTIIKPYYRKLVNGFEITADDKVLDYCSGSGIISKEILKRLASGQLVCADISEKWLAHAANKLKRNDKAKTERICNFTGKISGGEYDIILMHFSLHDFPREYRPLILNQLAENLKTAGRIYIREPLGSPHGVQLHELINLLEHVKKLSYEYEVRKDRFVGEYVDIYASLKSENSREILYK